MFLFMEINNSRKIEIVDKKKFFQGWTMEIEREVELRRSLAKGEISLVRWKDGEGATRRRNQWRVELNSEKRRRIASVRVAVSHEKRAS